MKQDNRKYQRLAKECRVEYCLFKSIVTKEGLRESSLNDLNGGGASFLPVRSMITAQSFILRFTYRARAIMMVICNRL